MYFFLYSYPFISELIRRCSSSGAEAGEQQQSVQEGQQQSVQEGQHQSVQEGQQQSVQAQQQQPVPEVSSPFRIRTKKTAYLILC